jgi:hypothetical protein
MSDDFDGLGWREYMRGIENGNIDPTGERLRAVCRLAREKSELLRAALQEIAEGRGTYSRDPLTHASNTIDEMKALALSALSPTTLIETPKAASCDCIGAVIGQHDSSCTVSPADCEAK